MAEGVTLEESVTWGLTEQDAPPWIESYTHLAQVVQAGDVIEARGTLIAGSMYEIGVWDASTQDAHVAVWLSAVEPAG